MSKVLIVIRSTNENSLRCCIDSVENRGFNYKVIHDDSSLENKSKETIRIGSEFENEYDWIMAVDADLVLSKPKEWIESYCDEVEEQNKDSWFCFCGWIYCTQRGVVSGIHFFRTKYCKYVYNIIKDMDFSFHKGREEYEICKEIKSNHGLNWDTGFMKEPFAVHLFDVNKK